MDEAQGARARAGGCRVREVAGHENKGVGARARPRAWGHERHTARPPPTGGRDPVPGATIPRTGPALITIDHRALCEGVAGGEGRRGARPRGRGLASCAPHFSVSRAPPPPHPLHAPSLDAARRIHQLARCGRDRARAGQPGRLAGLRRQPRQRRRRQRRGGAAVAAAPHGVRLKNEMDRLAQGWRGQGLDKGRGPAGRSAVRRVEGFAKCLAVRVFFLGRGKEKRRHSPPRPVFCPPALAPPPPVDLHAPP